MKRIGDVDLIERKDWGATPYNGQPAGHIPKRIVVHHTYQPTAEQYLKCARDQDRLLFVKRIQRYHQLDRGWADIGYHYLIGPDGKVFEGRDVALIGSHCGGTPPAGVKRKFSNTGSVGISVIGNYDDEKPSAQAIDSLNRLLGYLMSCYSISADNLFGHFEAWATPPKTCPGKLMVSVLGSAYPRLKNAWNAAYPKNPAK